MSDRIVYKVMSAAELQQMQRDGVFHGSPADIAPTATFICRVVLSFLRRWTNTSVALQNGLLLAAVDLSRLGDAVRWEPSRGPAR